MQHEGQWLTGKVAAHRIQALEEKLNALVVSSVNVASDTDYQRYEPWMTSPVQKAKEPVFSSKQHLTRRELEKTHKYLSDGSANLAGMGMRSAEFHVLHEDDREIESFYADVDAAMSIVRSASSELGALWDSLIKQVLPLEPDSEDIKVRLMGSGVSNHHYRGAIFTHRPIPEDFRIEEFAINLVHELGHHVLMVYQYADRLFECDPETEVYSAIRKVNRPLVMSFHALVALTFMCELARISARKGPEKSCSYFEKRLHEISFDLQMGLKAMEQIKFTAFGDCLVREMRSVLSLARCA